MTDRLDIIPRCTSFEVSLTASGAAQWVVTCPKRYVQAPGSELLNMLNSMVEPVTYRASRNEIQENAGYVWLAANGASYSMCQEHTSHVLHVITRLGGRVLPVQAQES